MKTLQLTWDDYERCNCELLQHLANAIGEKNTNSVYMDEHQIVTKPVYFLWVIFYFTHDYIKINFGNN